MQSEGRRLPYFYAQNIVKVEHFHDLKTQVLPNSIDIFYLYKKLIFSMIFLIKWIPNTCNVMKQCVNEREITIACQVSLFKKYRNFLISAIMSNLSTLFILTHIHIHIHILTHIQTFLGLLWFKQSNKQLLFEKHCRPVK